MPPYILVLKKLECKQYFKANCKKKEKTPNESSPFNNVKITLCIKQIVIHGTHYESDY